MVDKCLFEGIIECNEHAIERAKNITRLAEELIAATEAFKEKKNSESEATLFTSKATANITKKISNCWEILNTVKMEVTIMAGQNMLDKKLANRIIQKIEYAMSNIQKL